MFSSRIPAAVVTALLLAAGAASAQETERFRTLSVGISGGFQSWSLSDLEQTLGQGTAQFGEQGFLLAPADFGLTYSYGLEIQVRLTELLFLRGQAEWTRLKWDDRDRRTLAELTAPNRDGFSLSYESRVKSRPFLFALGAGVAKELTSLRVGLSGNLVIAPLEVEDNVVLTRELAETATELTSTGTGAGFEADLGVDWFTDVRTNLFLELFWRTGSATVSLDQSAFESSLFPGERRVDLDSAGLRVGFRWI